VIKKLVADNYGRYIAVSFMRPKEVEEENKEKNKDVYDLLSLVVVFACQTEPTLSFTPIK
jgi:hypothetical protein